MFIRISLVSLFLLCALVSTASSFAVTDDITEYEYTEAGKNKLKIYKHDGVDAADRKTIGRYIKQAQKFLSRKPPSPTYVHMFHSTNSDLLSIGEIVCNLKGDSYPTCPASWAQHGSEDNAAVDDGGKGTLACNIALGEKWWSSTSGDRLGQQIMVSAHEYFHCHQLKLADYFEAEERHGWPVTGYPDEETAAGMSGPTWLIEGSAQYFGFNFSAMKGEEDYVQQMQYKMNEAQESRARGARLEKYVSQDQSDARGDLYAYNGGMWAAAYLAHLKGSNKEVFIDYYKDIAELEREWREKGIMNNGWEASFEKHFSMTVKRFYKVFNKFMKKSLSKQVKILMSPGAME